MSNLLLTGPNVDRALTLLALITTAKNPVERDRYEHNLKALRSAHPEVHDIRDDDPRIEPKVAELKAAFAQPAPGFYLKCGSHWDNIGAGYCVSADAAHATRFESWDEASDAKAQLEARPYAGIHDIVEVK